MSLLRYGGLYKLLYELCLRFLKYICVSFGYINGSSFIPILLNQPNARSSKVPTVFNPSLSTSPTYFKSLMTLHFFNLCENRIKKKVFGSRKYVIDKAAGYAFQLVRKALSRPTTPAQFWSISIVARPYILFDNSIGHFFLLWNRTYWLLKENT